MADPIQISALGRDAQVGDFYNYFTDVISTSSIDVPNERKKISEIVGERMLWFFYKQPEKFKHHILGLNSHLLQSIKSGSVPGHQLWFADYLHTNSMDGDKEHAQVTLLFRIVQRTETLDFNFIRSKIDDYRLRSVDGGATHVIDEVVYGAEVICSLRKALLDLSRETKATAEFSIYLAANKYLNETIVKSTSLELPVELDQVSCTVLSSIEPCKKKDMSIDSFSLCLQDLLSSVTGKNQKKWKPIEFRLRNIPVARIEARMWSDRKADISIEKEQHEMKRKWMIEEIRDISNDPSLERFPLLEKRVCHFQDLMPHFWKNVEVACKKYEIFPPEKAFPGMLFISSWLNKIIDWIAYRRKEVQEIGWLLSGTDFKLLNSEEIKARMTNKECKIAKLFVLKVEYVQDVLIHELETLVGQPTSNAVRPVLPIFSREKGRLQSVRTALNEFASEAKLATWGSEHGANYHVGLDPNPSMLNDVAVVAVNYSFQTPLTVSVDNPVEYFEKQQREFLLRSFDVAACLPVPLTPTVVSNQNQQLKTDKDSEPTNKNFKENSTAKLPDNDETVRDYEAYVSDIEMDDAGCSQYPTGSTKTNSSMEQVYSAATIVDQKGPIGLGTDAERLNLPMEQLQLSDAKAKEQSATVVVQPKKNLNDGESKEQNSRVNKPKSCTDERDERYTKTHPLSSSEKGCMTQCQGRSEKIVDGIGKGKVHEDVEVDPYDDQNYRQADQENKEFHDNRRIAEIYADESRSYSTLIGKGSPNVYLLNATEKSNDDKIKWFDICRPNDPMRFRNPKNHKIIILMGATGSGKSTLINGMINYILGVQWNDPFRFKCVREDEGVARNQAHSQTSSVTAYTLRHQEGMSIPHSITIIDTPGYGDTRGIERDKKITANIHRFLTQEETRINEIHAACFVAASGDSRLTATQRYIIDSVLSIFGKDMKENLRLLVTFADNADPPVVEACGAANFPSTSVSAGISYSKFNSSVLYCSNAQKENEFCFDELFWDMGQENFHKFFTMLAKMDARNLTSTREVIQRRQQLEQSLQEIESELEICLVNIEDMEKFRQQLREHGHNMKTNKNFVVERTETQLVKVDCDKGLLVFNCSNCMTTCDKPSRKIFKNRTCTNEVCKCQKSDHQVQPFTWILRPVKVKRTLNEMKAKFESSANQKCTTEELMANCSDELNIAKAKVLSLLDQVGANARSLDSTALRSNALNPSEYLSLMRSRVLEEQAPGYLTRLQTLTELQQSFDASATSSAKKGQSSGSQVTTQPFNNANTSLGRGRLLQTSATGSANASESKSNNPGKNGLDNTLSRSSQIPQTSCGQVTAPSVKRYETRSHIQPNMNGTDPSKSASITSSNTQTCGGFRGRGRGCLSQQTETAASLIHGTDSQWKHPPGTPEEYYQTAGKTSQRPCSKDGDKHNPDGSNDSATGPSSSVQGDTKQEPKVIPSFNHPGDDKGTYSSDDENKKSEGLIASACRSVTSLFWYRK